MTEKEIQIINLAHGIAYEIFKEDNTGRLLYFFAKKLCNILKLKAFDSCIDDKYKFVVIAKDECERLKGKNMKCNRQVVDDRAFEKNYNIEWYLSNGEIRTTSAIMTSIENGYIFFRYPSGGIFMVKDDAIRSLECLE